MLTRYQWLILKAKTDPLNPIEARELAALAREGAA